MTTVPVHGRAMTIVRNCVPKATATAARRISLEALPTRVPTATHSKSTEHVRADRVGDVWRAVVRQDIV